MYCIYTNGFSFFSFPNPNVTKSELRHMKLNFHKYFSTSFITLQGAYTELHKTAIYDLVQSRIKLSKCSSLELV